MENDTNMAEWVWAIVEKSGENESFYALSESTSGATFIPVFKNQVDGQIVLQKIEKKSGADYEIQAVRLNLAGETAVKNKVELKILDGQGKVLETLSPIE